MSHIGENTSPGVVAPDVLGATLWEDIPQLCADWIGAAQTGDPLGARGAEQRLRFFALTYASLMPNAASVTTGRKAVLRSIYERLGNVETAHVSAMLDCVIAHEEVAAGRDGGGWRAH